MAGLAEPLDNDYACFNCGSDAQTLRGEGCWWCEPDAHAEPEEMAAFRQTPEEEEAMIVHGMLYIATKLAELKFTGEMS